MARLRLLVDTREHALMTELDRRLSSAQEPVMECRSEMLDVGDVHICVDDAVAILVERKTLADLAASMRDGRYSEQKARAVASGAGQIMYVIEVTHGALHLGDGAMSDVNGMPAARIQGCIMSLIRSERIRIVFTRSVDETAGLLIRLGGVLLRRADDAKDNVSYERVACAASSVRARKRDNVDPRLCYLQQLCQIPGVSHGIATSIASAYPTMRALLSMLEGLPDDQARQAQLAKVPMVGRKLSDRLCQFMFPT